MKRIADDRIGAIVSNAIARDLMGESDSVFVNDIAGIYTHKGKKYIYRISRHGVHYFAPLELLDNEFVWGSE